MKIAFLVTHFPSISETFILNRITGLLDRGHEVTIFARPPLANKLNRGAGLEPTEVQHQEIEQHKLLERVHYSSPMSPQILLRAMTATKVSLNFWKHPLLLAKTLNVFHFGERAASLNLLFSAAPLLSTRPQFDIIHCHHGPNGQIGSALKDWKLMSGQLIVSFYGADVTRWPRVHGPTVYQNLFRKSDAVLALSDCMRRQLIELGASPEQISVHHLGVDTEKHSYRPPRKKGSAPLQVLTIGRLVEKKGIEYAIRSIAKLIKNGIELQFQIIGDGPLRASLQKIIEEQEISSHVQIIGWKSQQEVASYLTNSDVLLVPSVTAADGDTEGTPTVIVEAMAKGLPVISTQHSGIPEMIVHGKSGYLVPERDVDALAEALQQFAEQPETWRPLSEYGRGLAEQHFAVEKLTDKLVQIYEKVL